MILTNVYDLDFNKYQNLTLQPDELINGYYIFQAINTDNNLNIIFGINLLRLSNIESPM